MSGKLSDSGDIVSDTGDAAVLDDVAAIEAVDAAGILRDIATSGAQIRQAVSDATEAGVNRLAVGGRPRAVVVTGMGGSGIAGDVLAVVAGIACAVPITVHRG